jgi:flagellar hook-length control protein FliK
MENVSANPLASLVAADRRIARESVEAGVEETGTFEQALGLEMAMITPEPTSLTPDLLAAANVTVAADNAFPTDGTEILNAILDSASILPGTLPSTATPAVETFEPGTIDPSSVGHPAAVAAMQASAIVANTGAEALDVPMTQDVRAGQRAAGLSALPQSDAAELTAANGLAATLTTTELLPIGGATLMPAPEAPARLQKNSAAAAKDVGPASAIPAASSEAGETRETQMLHPTTADRLSMRTENAPERAQIAASGGMAAAERVVTPETPVAAAEPSSPLDALSSAALISKWSSTPHTASTDNVTAHATARIDTPVGTEGWGDALRQKIVWLVDRGQQSAELHVNPPHLGPVEVVLNLADDGARIVFSSPHASVRDAIEASLAELRTALAERGLALGEALVSADPGTAREQLRDQAARSPQRLATAGAETLPGTMPETVTPVRQGLVDIFA